MNRREFAVLGGAAVLSAQSAAHAQSDALKQLLAEVANDPSIVEDGWQFQEPTVSRGVGHGTPSKRKLSGIASDLIIAFEVASPAVYEKKYRRPIWPKGASGVTIGVGYDLRFANKSYIDRDWPMLSASDRALLASVATLSGERAREATQNVQAVVVPWQDARTQFFAFLPYPTKQTEDAFPNCGKLHDDSFGALVSLVYNRGPKINRNSKTRREMYEIQQSMQAMEFDRVPAQIRSMKRLWQTPESRGLVRRREAEALLFEQGLRA